jgi:hypothetical protein
MVTIINGEPCGQWRLRGILHRYKKRLGKISEMGETVPYTLRNPLYHWTHLELQRYFDVHDILNPGSAKKIYKECSAKLQTDGLFCSQFVAENECETNLHNRRPG